MLYYFPIFIIFVSFLQYSTQSSSPRTLKLCLYLKAIRRSSVECDTRLNNLAGEEYSSNFTTISPLAKIIANIEKRNEKTRVAKKFRKPLPICKPSLENGFKLCRADPSCSSGYSCENSSRVRCCMEQSNSSTFVQRTEDIKTCPSKSQMNYFCQSSHGRKKVKKCRVDDDCMFSNVQKCCDAGCGFNVCVVATGDVTQNTLIFLGS